MSFILLGILNSQVTASGGAAAYEWIETSASTSAVSSVTFSNLNTYTDYKHLQIRMVTRAADSVVDRFHYLNFNSSSTGYYAAHYLLGDGSSVIANRSAATSYIELGRTPTAQYLANQYGATIIDILDFSSTSKTKVTRAINGVFQSNNYEEISLRSGLWNNTSAITSITLTTSGNWAANSRFSLYGIR